MRDRLVHAYFEINVHIAWQTGRQDLPMLIAQLELAVRPNSGDS